MAEALAKVISELTKLGKKPTDSVRPSDVRRLSQISAYEEGLFEVDPRFQPNISHYEVPNTQNTRQNSEMYQVDPDMFNHHPSCDRTPQNCQHYNCPPSQEVWMQNTDRANNQQNEGEYASTAEQQLEQDLHTLRTEIQNIELRRAKQAQASTSGQQNNAPLREQIIDHDDTFDSYISMDQRLPLGNQNQIGPSNRVPIYAQRDNSKKVFTKKVTFNEGTADNQTNSNALEMEKENLPPPQQMQGHSTPKVRNTNEENYAPLPNPPFPNPPRQIAPIHLTHNTNAPDIRRLPRIKREFSPDCVKSWCETLNQLFMFYAIDDDITKYYLAIENINSVFMDRLSPYVKERTWSSLQHGINKVYGTLTYAQKLNIVESLTMSSTPRQLLNKILTTLGLSINGLQHDKLHYIKHTFMKKLPVKIRMSLMAVSDDASIDEICEVAMKCYHTLNGEEIDKGLSQEMSFSEVNVKQLSDVKEQLHELRSMMQTFKPTKSNKSQQQAAEPLNYANAPQAQNPNRYQTPNSYNKSYDNQNHYRYPNNNPRHNFGRNDYRNHNNYQNSYGQTYATGQKHGNFHGQYTNQNRQTSHYQNSYRPGNYRNQQTSTRIQPHNNYFNLQICKFHRMYGDKCFPYVCNGESPSCQYQSFLEQIAQRRR